MRCIFATDLHGRKERYATLFGTIERERPDAVLLGGDLLPRTGDIGAFVGEWLVERPLGLGEGRPAIFVIMGNDDPKIHEPLILFAQKEGAVRYIHGRMEEFKGIKFAGFSLVPPSPFLLKDWEHYDISRHVDVGAVPPEEGMFTTEVDRQALVRTTIAQELERLWGAADLSRTVILFHAPPYGTGLDRAALDGLMVDHAPLDVHVGSMAIKRFIQRKQPLMTLHGHIHESATLTGVWKETIGRTVSIGGAYEGAGLCLVRFDPFDPQAATRTIER